jgi:hypothetical protein
MESHYTKLRSLDVSKHIEKKNNLSYLSWAWAVDQLLQHDPQATWEYKEPARFGDTLMVFCSVTAFGKTMTCQLPVMDHRNKAISNPDSFAVNTAMQRCLAKAIALHGIGLYIYAGEDLPEAPPEPAFDMDGSLLAIRESDSLAALKDVYTAAMKKASPSQQAELTDAKDARKIQLTTTH